MFFFLGGYFLYVRTQKMSVSNNVLVWLSFMILAAVTVPLSFALEDWYFYAAPLSSSPPPVFYAYVYPCGVSKCYYTWYCTCADKNKIN